MRVKVVFGAGKMMVSAPAGLAEGRQVKTVLMSDVTARSANLVGEMVEDFSYPITPRREITLWPKMRYVVSRGQWVDTHSGAVVSSAKAVYIVDAPRRTFYYLEG